MDAQSLIKEKPALEELPPPTTSVREQPTAQSRFRFIRRLVLFSALSFLAVQYVTGGPAISNDHRGVLSASDVAEPVNSYWSAIVSKGSRYAVSSCSTGYTTVEKDKHHGKHGKHGKNGGHKDHRHHHHKHEHDHPHSPHHGHRGPPGFIPPHLAEKIFVDVPNNDSARATLRKYTSIPHSAGSSGDFVTALWTKNAWERELGLPLTGADENIYDAGSPESQARIHNGMDKLGVWIDTYYPVMNKPTGKSLVTLLTDPPFHAKLREDLVEGDPDSVFRDEVPVFHGLSTPGDVKAQFFYAGYGRKRDFELLQEKGVEIEGKIAIVKYGGVFRGLKVKAAAEAGAIGCIIFSDPGDDGEITAENGYKAYPDGPARNPSSVQRGSVQYLSYYPGDPTTPGEPSYPNATRVAGGNFPDIPSLPMSFEDIIPILTQLNGKGIKVSELGDEWVGGLGYYGVDYHTGPSEVDLHMVNDIDTRVMPIWNTMAVIPGHITDEVIVLGNHRDAWILGAADPNSGTAAQQEIVRGLGKLIHAGWKPMRSIVLASWDAEEYGLIGSTEWAEDFGPTFLKAKVAAYLNIDAGVGGGQFVGSASPSLRTLIQKTAADVLSSKDASMTVWDTWKIEEFGDDILSIDKSPDIGALGSGSDFTPFLQHFGVASALVQFSPDKDGAVYHYHSIYDSFNWMDTFSDPGFYHHQDIAKLLGIVLLRLGDGLVLPLNSTSYARELGKYLGKLQKTAQATDHIDEVKFDKLDDSINSLIASSLALDSQAEAALLKLRALLPKPHKHPKHGFLGRITHAWRRVRAGCGSQRHRNELSRMQRWPSPSASADEQMAVVLASHGQHGPKHSPHPPHIPEKKLKQIKEVLQEIRSINKKLQHFEKGFISEKGLIGREWYKHKGVAPGRWLGYGATTFPGVTEALTLDHDVEVAQKEADELAEMIHAMAKRLSA